MTMQQQQPQAAGTVLIWCLYGAYMLLILTVCDNSEPSEPSPGQFKRYFFMYNDQGLGNVERNYIIQIPMGRGKIFHYTFDI